MFKRFLTSLACALALAAPVQAEIPVEVELRPGWRLPNGDHMAALHLHLAPGWKTYWRAPGDAGFPPVFDWSGSRNIGSVSLMWPAPHVFWQSGMRSIGYKSELVLPIRIRPSVSGDVALNTEIQLGVCSDICVPQTVQVRASLPASDSRVDPVIAAALAAAPYTESEASVGAVRCSVSPTKGGLSLRAEIDMPAIGGGEEMAIESGLPQVWAAEPTSTRQGGTLVAQTRLMHLEGKPFALDRSRLRFTVFGQSHAVDIQGCDS